MWLRCQEGAFTVLERLGLRIQLFDTVPVVAKPWKRCRWIRASRALGPRLRGRRPEVPLTWALRRVEGEGRKAARGQEAGVEGTEVDGSEDPFILRRMRGRKRERRC